MILLGGAILHDQDTLPQPANVPDGAAVTVLTHAWCRSGPSATV